MASNAFRKVVDRPQKLKVHAAEVVVKILIGETKIRWVRSQRIGQEDARLLTR